MNWFRIFVTMDPDTTSRTPSILSNFKVRIVSCLLCVTSYSLGEGDDEYDYRKAATSVVMRKKLGIGAGPLENTEARVRTSSLGFEA